MSPKKNFKFYYHNSAFLKLSGISKSKARGWKAAWVWLARFLYEVSYWVGYVLYEFSILAREFSKQDWQKTAKSVNSRLKKFALAKPVMNFAVFTVIILLPFGLLEGFRLAARALDAKDQLIRYTAAGLEQFQKAKTELGQQDFKSAGNSFTLAKRSFETGKGELSQVDGMLGGLANLAPMKRQADLLIQTAQQAAQVGTEFSVFADQMSQLEMTPAGFAVSTNAQFGELLDRMEASVASIDRGIAIIAVNLKQIDVQSLPQEYRQQFVEKFQSFSELSGNFQNLKSLFEMFRLTFGGHNRILVLLENNNELRSTGGFIGSFAAIDMKDGNIKSLNVDSVYSLDGQLKENIAPPQPILNVSNKWFLRDANWFADFPLSAQKISAFYEKEGGETPDIIMAMTPNLIADLLALTGPVEMPKYQVTLTSENFVELTQVASSDYATMPENKPKQILADLVPVLFDRLSKLTEEQKTQFLAILQKNLYEKQILLYSRNGQLQNTFKNFGWAGEIKPSDRDYLSVVGSNLEATKSDLYIEQSLKLETAIARDGSITDRLTITRHNKLPALDKTFNNSYIRVLVPEGSKLLENQGFDFKVQDAPRPFGQKTDDDVLAWEKSAVRDVVSGTTIGRESGKTFFGNWQRLEGGETREITLVYQLPYKLKDIDRYSLLLQKQPGALNQPFVHQVRFEDRKMEWSNFQPQDLTANSFSQTLDLNRDQMLGAVFVRR